MPPAPGYAFKPHELYAHATAVAKLQAPLDRVVAVTKDASPDGIDVAYGALCQFYALQLRGPREYAEDVVGKISRATDSAANQLIKAVDTYVQSETQSSAQLRKIGETLPPNAPKLIAKNTNWSWKDYDFLSGDIMTNMDKENGGSPGTTRPRSTAAPVAGRARRVMRTSRKPRSPSSRR